MFRMLKHRSSSKPYDLTKFRTIITFPRYLSSQYDSQDPYTVLGASRNEPLKSIHEKWLDLCRKLHPDINKDKNATEYLKKVNAAYQSIKTMKVPPVNQQGYEDSVSSTQRYKKKEYKRSDEYRRESSSDSYSDFQAEDTQAESTAEKQEKRKKEAKNEEEAMFFRIFGFYFKEDPTAYYKPENANKRKAYEDALDELRKIRGYKAAQDENIRYESWNAGEEIKRRQREKFESSTGAAAEQASESRKYQKHSAETTKDMSPKADTRVALTGRTAVIIMLGILLLGTSVYKFLKERGLSLRIYEEKVTRMTDEELKNIREKHFQKEANKKQKKREAFLNSLALMKMYPRQNPDAIDILIDYTIWPDLKIYHVAPDCIYESENFELSDKFERYALFNVRLNTMVTLALESERVLKHYYVKVSDVIKSLEEKGYYESPGAFFRYFGFMYIKVRRKPIIAENLKACIDRKENYISVFDLFFNYSTPVLLANDQYFEIPLKHQRYIPDTTTREFGGWVGNASINHRPIIDKYLADGKKNLCFYRKKDFINTPYRSEYMYSMIWGSHYDKTLRKY